MKPFYEYDLRTVIYNQLAKLNKHIEGYNNDEIMANDLSVLADNCYEQFFIAPVSIGEEEFERREIVQKKIKHWVDLFWRDPGGKEYVFIDGFLITFSFPYSGEGDLFKCKASTFSLSGYPEIDLSAGFIAFNYEMPISELQTEVDKDKLMKKLERDLSSIKTGISYANADVEVFNQSLRQTAYNKLQERRKKVEQFFSASKLFEIPLKRTAYADTHIPIQRKIQPISRKYNNEPSYCISDAEYKDIILTIKHNGSTYERTPDTFKTLQEEDLRNLLLAALNGTYQGNATGETFRKNGKTDICIECENRAAFVAECKIWKGQSKVAEAISQLDGYLTWRDCKTALIFFVRNKDFFAVLDTIKHTLREYLSMRQVRELDSNEFECTFVSQSIPGQIIRMQVILFNLYAK